MLADTDGLHMIVSTGREEHRLLLPGPELPPIGTPLVARLDLDADARHRANAALKFRIMARARRGGYQRPSKIMADYPTVRLMRMLQAFDARRVGATWRAIAVALFGAAEVAKVPSWKTSSLRETVISLDESASALVDGGYIDLLRPRKTGFRNDL
jgi:hypothetical protein